MMKAMCEEANCVSPETWIATESVEDALLPTHHGTCQTEHMDHLNKAAPYLSFRALSATELPLLIPVTKQS